MSPAPRFQSTGTGSFFGDWLCENLGRKRPHFLFPLKKLIDWGRYRGVLLRLYKGKGVVGRPPYDPVLTFKMLFLSYLYGESERAMEYKATWDVAVKYFLGLAVDEVPPDHSTLTVFKNRIIAQGNWDPLVMIFDGIIEQAMEHGLELGPTQIEDSVHTEANVNNQKDRERQEKGKPPRDPDAQVVNKGKREVVEPDGHKTTRQIRYRGYKTHVSVNAETGLTTTVIPARGNTADNKAFAQLLEHDQSLNLPTTTYGGDRAYDDTDIHERIEAAGLHSGICLHDYRTKKRDPNKQRWFDLLATPEHQAATKLRYRVEQPFGTAKRQHCFARCRYLGLLRYGIQAFLTFMVVNCKRIIKLLTGITFREQAKGRRAEPIKPVYASLPWV
jgi:IS5 family transposase